MATHRAQSLLNVNRALWLGDMKWQDPAVLPKKLLLLKAVRQSEAGQKLRYNAAIAANNYNPNLSRRCTAPDDTVYLPLPIPILSHYPNTFKSVLQYNQTSARSQANPLPELDLNPKAEPSHSPDKPSLDQMLKVYNNLQFNLPRLFTHTMDYTIYNQHVELINNLVNKKTSGLFKYVQQVALLRVMGHLKYAYVKLDLVSMSQEAKEGRITVKWRVIGVPGLRVMLKFWKFKLWKYQEMLNQHEVWYEAISHFHVGPDGLVFQHIIDKIEEDEGKIEAQKAKSPLLAKLALIAALFPRNELEEALACGGSMFHTTSSVEHDGTGSTQTDSPGKQVNTTSS